jgi:hypothetical protein
MESKLIALKMNFLLFGNTSIENFEVKFTIATWTNTLGEMW